MLFMLLARSTLKTPLRLRTTLGTNQGVAGSLSGPSHRRKGPGFSLFMLRVLLYEDTVYAVNKLGSIPENAQSFPSSPT